MKKMLIGSVLVLSMVAVAFAGCFGSDNTSWGDKGELSLDLSLDRTSMGLNGSINAGLFLTNVGDTDVRVVDKYHILLEITDVHNASVVEEGDSPIYSSYQDSDLTVISAGEDIIKTIEIRNNWHYNLSKPGTYHVKGVFFTEDYTSITLPYWKGKIYSSQVEFEVIDTNPYHWGDRGELSLNLSLDKTTMDYYETTNATWDLKNIGKTPVRVLAYYLFENMFYVNTNIISILDPKNNSVGHIVFPPKTPVQNASDKDLDVLNPGDTISLLVRIDMRWYISEDQTYRVQAIYPAYTSANITLPYWSANLKSEELELKVT
jgi:hypothetical protein